MSPLFEKGGRINEYIVLERTHAGGKSDIYFADDTKNRRKVALKIYHAGVMTEDQNSALLSHEQGMANLDHPGLVPCLSQISFRWAISARSRILHNPPKL